MSVSKSCLLEIAIILFTVPASFGMVIVPVSDEDLVDMAPAIAHVRVDASTVFETSRGIVTRYQVEALSSYKGSVAGVFAFDLPGGRLPDGRGLLVPGVPVYRAGEQLLLFLDRPVGAGVVRPLFDIQGVFSRQSTADGTVWRRADAEAPVAVAVADAEAAYRSARHGDRFAVWLGDRAQGIHRPADYRLVSAPTPPTPRAKFTLSRNPPVRWLDFDDGGAVEWFWHVPPGTGSVANALALWKTARQIWNRAPRAGVRMIPGGPISTFSFSDAVSTLIFEDPNDALGGAYECSRGGLVFAVFIRLDRNSGERWKGQMFDRVVSADFTFNDGSLCWFDRGRSSARTLARQLGFTLGLGPSCGGSSRRPCVQGTPEGEAIMGLLGGPSTRPLALGADDIDGIRFLYDPTFNGSPTPGCDLSPGDPRYCTDCGPCPARFGDCDRDSECGPGLVCVNDQGAGFGFAPGIDVCLRGNTPDEPQCTLGSGRFCTACGPCGTGQGDCDSDAECAPGLQCVDNVGAQFGFAGGVDVCLPGGEPPTCTSSLGRGDFCSTPGCGPCGIGQGDCDSDAECAPGLRCVQDIGPQFGFGPRVDVCQ